MAVHHGAGLYRDNARAVEAATALARLECRPVYIVQATSDGAYFWVVRIPASGDQIISLVDGEGRVFTPAAVNQERQDQRRQDLAGWCRANGRHSFYLGVCGCGATASLGE